jgi:nucleotide-binding universal stress UspA family protein
MYDINRVLICLDLSNLDEVLMKYTAMLDKFMKLEKIYMLHVSKDLELEEEITSKHPDLIAPLDETIEREIKRSADAIFAGLDTEIEIEVLEGDPFEKVLRWSKVKEIDLMVMGRKEDMDGSGFFPVKMANLLLCSILFVPEIAIAKIEKILVPFDFTEFSDFALEEALFIKEKYNAEVICQHVYEVPQGYQSTGKSYEEFAEIMRENAVKKFENHIRHLDGFDLNDFEVEYTLRKDKNLGYLVTQYANKVNVDLIIAGSRGRTPMASLLLGSVAGKLISYDNHLPLMIVKYKEGNMNLFEALLNI